MSSYPQIRTFVHIVIHISTIPACLNANMEIDATLCRLHTCHQTSLCGDPWSLALILTHIFGKDRDKRIDKAEILLALAMRVVLPSSLAKSVCKMWVRNRSLAMGRNQ